MDVPTAVVSGRPDRRFGLCLARSLAMKIWILLAAGACILFAAQFAQTQPGGGGDPRGSYEGIAASANAVWVIDTRSGQVRKCTQEFADQTPVCSDMSN
jgi:hypothetical protein